jgi:hypothetical protein
LFLVNPYGKEHGAPSDSERHVGDLGNIKTDANGNAKGSVQDKLIKLIGAQSVIGVSLLSSDVPFLMTNNSTNSALLLCTLALMIWAREVIQTQRRLATQVDVPLVVRSAVKVTERVWFLTVHRCDRYH